MVLKTRIMLFFRTEKLTHNFNKISNSELAQRYEVGQQLEELCQMFEEVFGLCGRGICFSRMACKVGEDGIKEMRLMQALACVFAKREYLPIVSWDVLRELLPLWEAGDHAMRIRELVERAEQEHWSRNDAKSYAAEERENIRFQQLKERYEKRGY